MPTDAGGDPPAGVDLVVSLCRMGTRDVPADVERVDVWLIDQVATISQDNPNLDFVIDDTARFVAAARDEGRTVLFVEHDMDMVRDISDWVIVMAQGKIIAEGPPDSVMGDQRVIDAYLGAHHDQELTFEAEEQILAEAEAEIAREHGDETHG